MALSLDSITIVIHLHESLKFFCNEIMLFGARVFKEVSEECYMAKT